MLDSTLARQRFFDKQVHMQKWKDSMAGENEDQAVKLLTQLGFKLGQDYFRQYPFAERFVIDFAFVKEQVALEVDGSTHLEKAQIKKDKARDKFLGWNNWIPLRVHEKNLFGYKGSFWKNLINEVVLERRSQWEAGILYPIDLQKYSDRDFL